MCMCVCVYLSHIYTRIYLSEVNMLNGTSRILASRQFLSCMWLKKQQNQIWNNWLVQNWEKSTSRLYTVTLLI